MKLKPTTLALLVSAALAGAAPAIAQEKKAADAAKPPVTTSGAVATAPGAAMAVETVKTTATIVAIEPATRGVTLKRQDGKVFSITAGEQVKRFNELKIGDVVTAEYTQALSLELKKGSTATGKSEQVVAARAPETARPGGAVGRQVTAMATVEAVDTAKKLVTLKGPEGRVVDLNIKDPEQLKLVKKGDKVEVVYTEALAVSVETAPKAPAKAAAKK